MRKSQAEVHEQLNTAAEQINQISLDNTKLKVGNFGDFAAECDRILESRIKPDQVHLC